MVKVVKAKYKMPVIIEKDKDGYYAERPASSLLRTGSHLRNIKDAAALYIKHGLAKDEKIEVPDMISVTTLEVSA